MEGGGGRVGVTVVWHDPGDKISSNFLASRLFFGIGGLVSQVQDVTCPGGPGRTITESAHGAKRQEKMRRRKRRSKNNSAKTKTHRPMGFFPPHMQVLFSFLTVQHGGCVERISRLALRQISVLYTIGITFSLDVYGQGSRRVLGIDMWRATQKYHSIYWTGDTDLGGGKGEFSGHTKNGTIRDDLWAHGTLYITCRCI